MAGQAAEGRLSLLCLGSGWTSKFLFPLLKQRDVSFTYTTSSQSQEARHVFRLGSESWKDDLKKLPAAQTVLIIFPIKDVSLLDELIGTYTQARGTCRWLMLGSTGVWKDGHHTSESPRDAGNARGEVEEHLLSTLGHRAAVLNLAGLYGDTRKPYNFVTKAAPSREKLREKNSLHLVHGDDVARAIAAMVEAPAASSLWGRRWIVSDTNSYDWWHLSQTMTALPEEYKQWAASLSEEFNVKLPRQPGNDPKRSLARTLDGQAFWKEASIEKSSLHQAEEIQRMGPEQEFAHAGL